MGKAKGFHLGRKLITFYHWTPKLRRKTSYYHRLNYEKPRDIIVTKFRNLINCLKTRLSIKHKSSNRNRLEETSHSVPKGYLAVYVGENEANKHRYLIPVVYFNHPLFRELLKEAEDRFGFQQHGGINIPCDTSEFENVQMKIAGETHRKPVFRHRSWN